MEIECTQRLECTQELYNTQIQKTDPEQIGFLGICGTKYAVKRGPNKIGRDPQTCHIHLNLNSISRQHAVINVLSMTEFMLMDLDSANKTKVQGKTLQPYIPHPLKNGDMVQLGEIFGVFRLLEEDNDLPMTQAIDLPCTPAPVAKQMSRLGAPSVLVPESPEVSDMDDSFIMPSQPKKSSEFKSPMNKFLKPTNKTIAIQPMGSKTIDNAYWVSAKKSDSFNFQLDDSGSTFNDSTVSNKSNKVIEESNDNIHEMETQVPYKNNDSTDSIYTANTQPPPSHSIHCMETQQPALDIYVQETQQISDIHALNTQNLPGVIHNCETQAPVNDNMPKVCKIDNQEDLQLDLLTANKENDNSIFNAETQAFSVENDVLPIEPTKSESLNTSIHEKSKDNNDSDEEIMYDELNTQSFNEEFESQPLIPAGNISPQIERVENIELSSNKIRRESGSSTDCEDFNIPDKKISTDIDMLPTQKIATEIDMLPTQKIGTDVHMLKTQKLIDDIDILPTQKIGNYIDMLPTQKILNDNDEDLTDCEDEVVNHDFKVLKRSPEIDFEDMATQIIGDDVIGDAMNKSTDHTDGPSKVTSFEELPTQLIIDDSKEENFEDMPTQIITDEGHSEVPNEEVYSEEIISPFKIPFQTPLKAKKTIKSGLIKTSANKVNTTKVDDNDSNYYAATQEIFDDLCTQRDTSPTSDNPSVSNPNEKCYDNDGDGGFEEAKKTSDKQPAKDKSISGGDDVELKTPKTLKIMNIDLPDSQEIKTSVTLKHKSMTESSSDSETDDVSDQESGIIIGKKRKPKHNAKMDLTKKFEESLPTRVITRVRKPTLKIRESDENAKNQCRSILKGAILIDSDDNIDADIINENISRLKSKTEKKREKECGNSKCQSDEPKKRSRNENKKAEKSLEESARSDKSSSRSTKREETKSKTDHQDNSRAKTVRSTRSTRNKRENNSKDSKSKAEKEKRETKEKDRSHSKSRSDSKSISDFKSRSDSETRSQTRSASKDTKSKDTKPKDKDSKHDKTHSPEIEVRRSSRHKSKDNKEVTPKHENSTVYLSSESSTESPKNLKRPASNELEVPSPKRTRSLPNSKSSSVSTTPASISVCSTPAKVETHYVLFTAFSNDDVRIMLEKLGAVVVTDLMACTVLVTLQVKRTFKLLCAIGLGRPVVGPDWVQACADTNTIVDPWLYIIKDTTAEKRFRFSLERTLRGKRNFLKGYNVSSTPNVLPNAQEMKLIVECSGGSWQACGPNWVCVTSSADRALWPALRRRGAALVSTEFILGGVLRQLADVDGTAFGIKLSTVTGGARRMETAVLMGNNPGAPAIKKKGEKEEKPEFVCQECGRRCLSRIGLASHARSHTKS